MKAYTNSKVLLFAFVSILTLGSVASFLLVEKGRVESAEGNEGQTRTLLSDGRFLLWGGEGPAAALWDPETEETVTLAAGVYRSRKGHTATVLPDGRVLVLGGVDVDGRVVEEAYLFDPEPEAFEVLPRFSGVARAYHSATLLTDGVVLVAGGLSEQGTKLDTALLWDPEWQTVEELPGRMSAPRSGHRARLLGDGTVFLAKGSDDPDDTGETYSPNDGSFTEVGGAPETLASGLVAASIPEAGSADVPLDTGIALRFSRPLDPERLETLSFSLMGPNGLEPVQVVFAGEGMLVFLSPRSLLLPGSVYTVTMTGATEPGGPVSTLDSFSFETSSRGGLASSGSPETSGPATTGARRGRQAEETRPGSSRGKQTSASRQASYDKEEVDEFKRWRLESAWKGKRRRGKPHSDWQSLPALEAGAGVTALSGQALTMSGLPLRDVTIGMGDRRAKTDETGRFLLTGIASGTHHVMIDGRTANTEDATYGAFMSRVRIKEGRTNPLRFTIWMPELDMENAVEIPSPTTSEVVVTTPRIPGLEVRIPPGTVIRDVDGKIVTKISLTRVPLDRGPHPLPPGYSVPLFFTMQPRGARLESVDGGPSPGLRVIFPNLEGLPAGARQDFLRPDEETGWVVYGQGRVSPDGAQIVPDDGISMAALTCTYLGSPLSLPDLWPPSCDSLLDCLGIDGDPVDLATGLFVLKTNDLQINDVIPIRLTRTYRPGDTESRGFGIGSTHPYDMFLVGDGADYSYAELILPDGGRIRYDRISPGTHHSDAVMEHNATPTKFYQSTLYWNSGHEGWEIKFKDGTIYEFFSRLGLFPLPKVLKAIRDRNGNKLTILRTGAGRAQSIITPNGRWIEFSYDGDGRITEVTDNIGRTVNYGYDTSGRLTTVTDVGGGVTEYTYDASHRILAIEDARDIVFLTNEYDADGRVVRQTQADGTTFLFSYTEDGNGNIARADVTDPREILRRVNFNGDGYVVSDSRAVGSPEEQTTTFERETGTNFVLSVTDALGRKTAFTYDAVGNRTSATRLAGTPRAVTASFTYEPEFNQLASITNPFGKTTTLSHDLKGNVVRVTDPLNNETDFAYNGAGQLATVADPLDNVTHLAYELADLASVTNPMGESIRRFSDPAGRLQRLTDPLNQNTFYEYDALNRLSRIVDPRQGEAAFTYDFNGNLLTVTDALGNITGYAYDDMDRLSSRTDPLLFPETYLYDENGNLASFTDRRGQEKVYAYDSLNRVSQITYADLSTTTFTYDGGNRLIEATDSLSGTITRTYDDLDRLTSETTPQGSVSYTYDDAGRRTSMTVTGETPVDYTYDDANRLIQIARGGDIVGLTYDAAGRRTGVTLPNGVLMEYGYDLASRLTAITYKLGMTVLGDLTYQYDAAGNRIGAGGSFARTELPDSLESAVYDAANRQLEFRNKTKAYDGNGNLTSLTSQDSSATNGKGGKGGGKNGRKGTTASTATTTYAWNARDQLTSVVGPTITASFDYDALGRRVRKLINGNTTEFVYDGVDPVQELDGPSVLANLINGLRTDEYYVRSDGNGTYSHLTDALGSTLALADASGSVQTEYTYAPFGNTTSSGAASENSFQYTGREDDGTGLYYYRARYYDPHSQRFISEDPIGFLGGDVNLYAYVRNNPINFTDPSGQAIGGAVLALGGGALLGVISGTAGCRKLISCLAAAATGGAIGLGRGALALASAPRLGVSIGLGIFFGAQAALAEEVARSTGTGEPLEAKQIVAAVAIGAAGGAAAGALAALGGPHAGPAALLSGATVGLSLTAGARTLGLR